MNFTKKMVCTVLLAAGCLTIDIQASDIRDEQGRTELMNLVIQKEQEIKLAQSDLQVLWDTYFYNESFNDGHNYDTDGKETPRYKYLPIRKIYTTDADVVLYRKQEEKFLNLIQMSIGAIDNLVRSGACINAKDLAGNTVLNYCYTQDIYDKLMYSGASFQLKVWSYFNPGYAMLAGFMVVPIAAGLVSVVAAVDTVLIQK